MSNAAINKEATNVVNDTLAELVSAVENWSGLWESHEWPVTGASPVRKWMKEEGQTSGPSRNFDETEMALHALSDRLSSKIRMAVRDSHEFRIAVETITESYTGLHGKEWDRVTLIIAFMDWAEAVHYKSCGETGMTKDQFIDKYGEDLFLYFKSIG